MPSRFTTLIAIRVVVLAATAVRRCAWLIGEHHLVRRHRRRRRRGAGAVPFAHPCRSLTNREIARFLNAIEFDDASQSFSDRGTGRIVPRARPGHEPGDGPPSRDARRARGAGAPSAVAGRARAGRAARRSTTSGGVRPLNSAARRLFTSRIVQTQGRPELLRRGVCAERAGTGARRHRACQDGARRRAPAPESRGDAGDRRRRAAAAGLAAEHRKRTERTGTGGVAGADPRADPRDDELADAGVVAVGHRARAGRRGESRDAAGCALCREAGGCGRTRSTRWRGAAKACCISCKATGG